MNRMNLAVLFLNVFKYTYRNIQEYAVLNMQEKCKKNAIHVHNKYKYAKICKPQICSYVKKTIFHS